MAGTLLLGLLIVAFISVLLFAIIKRNKLSKKKIFLSLSFMLIAIISLFLFTGLNKVSADISRIIRNSSPKSSIQIYTLLFKRPLDSCVTVINLKDQTIPKIDCCIWMEVKLCQDELERIINLRKYERSVFSKSDSLIFLKPFADRPDWWRPQLLNDSLVKLHIKFNTKNEQTIFLGSDSTHVFICDQAL